MRASAVDAADKSYTLIGARMIPSPEEYRLIPLTQGQFAKVSPHRYDELSKWKWHAFWSPITKSFYAYRTQYLPSLGEGRKSLTLAMHRQILCLAAGDKRQGDHENHDTLDNRDSNLRIATRHQNQANRIRQRNNRSGFKGVSFHKLTGKWQSKIRVDDKQIHLGLFPTAEAAHVVYCEAAKKHFKEFARQG